MIVIADSSPLNYLILIDADQILPQLFGRIVIPDAVARELQSSVAPAKVSLWVSNRPTWLRIEQCVGCMEYDESEKLDEGEREAIALALPGGADALLLIDESKGRRVAKRLGVRFIGTLGLLDQAARRGILDLPSAIESLLQTTFYVSPDILKALLAEDMQRKKAP